MKTSCLNCAFAYEGKFCPECGQKSHTHRITFSAILHDIPHSVWHIDKGFKYTFVELLKHPGKAIRDFIDGKRVRHYPPFGYLFIMSALSSLFAHFKVFYYKQVLHINLGFNPRLPIPEVAVFFNKYPALMFCALIPVLSLCTYLFNIKSKYNYWENLVMNTYLVSQFNLFFIGHTVIVLLIGAVSAWMVPMLTVFFTYISIGHSQFFPMQRSLSGFIKRIMMFIVVVLILLTGFSLGGFMTPWWGG